MIQTLPSIDAVRTGLMRGKPAAPDFRAVRFGGHWLSRWEAWQGTAWENMALLTIAEDAEKDRRDPENAFIAAAAYDAATATDPEDRDEFIRVMVEYLEEN